MTTRAESGSGTRVMALEGPVVADIRAHAAAAYPHECCGALIVRGSTVVEAVRLANGATDAPSRRFLVGPEAYREAEARAKAAGGVLGGFYHSHPDHPARPSAFDLDHALPNFIYVIIAVAGGRPGDATAWRLSEDRSVFEPEALLWPTES